jgi:hypothetical protein
MFLFLAAWKKRCPPDEFIAKTLEFAKFYEAIFIGVEEVAYQETLSWYLEKAIREQKLRFTVVPLRPGRESKDARNRSLQPLFREKRVAIADDDTLYLDEHVRFPKGERHLLDCASYQPRISQLPVPESRRIHEEHAQQQYLQSINQVYGQVN